jgi:hypothetical protein
MKRINPRMFDFQTEKQVLRELARIKAMFQQRTLELLLSSEAPQARGGAASAEPPPNPNPPSPFPTPTQKVSP